MRYRYFLFLFIFSTALSAQKDFGLSSYGEIQLNVGGVTSILTSNELSNNSLSDYMGGLSLLRSTELSPHFTFSTGLGLGYMRFKQEHRLRDPVTNEAVVVEPLLSLVQLGVPFAFRYFPAKFRSFYLSGGGQVSWNAIHWRSARMFPADADRDTEVGEVWPAGDFSVSPFLIMADVGFGSRQVQANGHAFYYALHFGYSLNRLVGRPRATRNTGLLYTDDARVLQVQVIFGTSL